MSKTHMIKIVGVTIEELEDAISELGISVNRIKTPWCDDIASWGLGDVDISLLSTSVQVHYCDASTEWISRGFDVFERMSGYLHSHHR